MDDVKRAEERAGDGRALRALATSALALPGIAGSAWADSPRERPELSYRYSWYKEDDTAQYKLAPGATTERMEVQSHQLHYGTPFTKRTDLDFNLMYESLSGASPIRIDPAPGGGEQLIMSGATIEEERVDFLASGSYYLDNGRAGAGIGVSSENDYLAVNLGFDGEIHVNDKNTTLLGGVSMSFDEIEPTDPQIGFRPESESKESYTVFAGIAQVINRHLAVQLSGTYRYSSGFLSDPYKEAFVGSGPVADTRPGERHQVAGLVRTRGHFDQLNGTLHADFQFSWDDWGVNAYTLELAWYQSLWEALQLVPQFRYYSQSQADFYEPTYQGPFDPNAFYSSDYRLSPFGALSYGLRAQTTFRGMWKTDWEAAISYERYVQDEDLAISRVSTPNPGLINYHQVSFRLTGRF